jgi:DNA-binding LacI/PurR family transcriptional regulator
MMLERIARPALPVRDVRLQCELVVRETCAAAQA